MAANVRLVRVSSSEVEKTLRLIVEYQEGEVVGSLRVYRVKRWLVDPEYGSWDQEEVLIEEVSSLPSSGSFEKEYVLPSGNPGTEEYSLRVSFFDGNNVGYSFYPAEEYESPDTTQDGSDGS